MNGAVEVSDSSIEGHGYRRSPKEYADENKKGSGTSGPGEGSKVVDGKAVSGHGYKRGTDGKKLRKGHSNGKGRNGKMDSKEEKKKGKKAVKGNFLKDSSSESDTSSSSSGDKSSGSKSEKSSSSSSERSSDSETDDSREKIIDDGRKYIIEVEPERGDEFRRKSSEPDIQPRKQYYDEYIRSRRPDMSDPLRKSTSDMKAWPELKDSKRRSDQTVMENDNKDMQKIREFRNDNLVDIGDLMNYIKSFNRYGPRSSRQRYAAEGKPPLLRREKIRKGNLKGGRKGTGYDSKDGRQKSSQGQKYLQPKDIKEGKRFFQERDKKPIGGHKRDSDHEHLTDTSSEDSRQRQPASTQKHGKQKKGVVGKLPPAGKFKHPYADTTKGGKGKKPKVTGADFKGSRINAVKRGVTPSHSDARSKEIKRNIEDEDKENKRVYFALIDNDDVTPNYLPSFRGISSGALTGKGIDNSADTKDGSAFLGKSVDLKGKSAAHLKDISNLENQDGRYYLHVEKQDRVE